MSNVPPPPPPHGGGGGGAKHSGLPPGNYDIFIIPPHAAGSGFLYLPSLKPNVNSFAAGFACALILVAMGTILAPAFQVWWSGVKGTGGMGMMLLMVAIGLGAWALGRTQTDGGSPNSGTTGAGGAGGNPNPNPNPGPGPGAHTNTGGHGFGAGPMPGGPTPGPSSPGPPPGPPPPGTGPGTTGGVPPRSGWERPNPPGATGAAGANTHPDPKSSANGAWERAREETKRRDEERKAKEAELKRKADLEKRLRDLREKEAQERGARERLAREKEEKEAAEIREKEAKAKEARDSRLREAREARERRQKEEEAKKEEAKKEEAKKEEAKKEEVKQKEAMKEEAKRKEAKQKEEELKSKGSTYAFSAVGEKTNPWPRGQPASPATARSQPPSPVKKPPPPTAKTHLDTDEDAYSFRPYDKPKKPVRKKSQSSLYSESSYAASQSTARTTPPQSFRGPYSTKDPDKIVIKAVYSFNNTFIKTPTSQLVAGVGSVTDGLILRITTEGLFIDDDVRGVPQREWDVKAWTMKLVEVWCPSFCQDPAGNFASARFASSAVPLKPSSARRFWGPNKDKVQTSEEVDTVLVKLLQSCKDNCYLRPSFPSAASSAFDQSSSAASGRESFDSAYASSTSSSISATQNKKKTNTDRFQTGEMKAAGLHVVRASIRDQEGKKYVFIVTQEESWKVAAGLQRLRKSPQVRGLGVSGMSSSDTKGTVENLGWT
jgi:hypothetical protein